MKHFVRALTAALAVGVFGWVFHGDASATSPPPAPNPSGMAAIRSLGDDLPNVAAANGMTADALKKKFLTDKTLKVTEDHQLYFEDNFNLGAPLSAAQLTALANEPQLLGPQWAGGSYSASTTFKLHSKRGSPLTIYLDFDGESITGTGWNTDKRPTMVLPPFDLDGKPKSFSASERAVIAQIWASVAESFATWDVDVTTQLPPLSDLVKSDAGDARYGIRVLTTPAQWVCQNKCVGVALFNSFGDPRVSPAFNFATKFPPAYQADTIAHEVGHTLRLSHDGTSTAEYYKGNSAWAPIVGSGTSNVVSQWSKGDYPKANNHEDDLAIISQTLPVEPDDYPDTLAASISLPGQVSNGLISTTGDKDWSSFTFAGGDLSVAVKPAKRAAVKLSAELWRSGKLYKKLTAVGMGGAIVVKNAPTGSYQMFVTGVATTAFPQYGSIGQYVVVLDGRFSFPAVSQVAVVPSTDVAAPGTQVTFSITATNDIAAYADGAEWSFSDGTTATGAHPVVTMPNEVLTARVSVPTMVFRNDGWWDAWSGKSGCPAGGVLIDQLTGLCGYSGGPPSSARGLVGLTSLPVVTAKFDAASITAGATLNFSYAAADPEYRDMTYRWTFSDGQHGTATSDGSVRVTPMAPGTFSATLTVTTADGVSVSSTASLEVFQRGAPRVVSWCTASSLEAPAVIDYWAASSDGGQPVALSWSLPDGGTAAGGHVVVSATTGGDKVATVTGTGFTGATASATATCSLRANTAPTLSSLNASATSWYAPAYVTFDMVAWDFTPTPLTYRLTISDGRTFSSARTAVTFSTPGTYQATATVTDIGGLTATKTAEITVLPNRPPVVVIDTSTANVQTAPSAFALSGVAVDPEGYPLRYAWSFSDGTSSTLANVSKSYTTSSVISATLTVTDIGGLTASASITLTTVANRAPVISSCTVSAQSAPAHTARLFSVTASDPDEQALSYLWTFADGTTAKVPSITKTFSTSGTFQATVTVTDPGGLSVTQTVSYTVT